MRKTAPAYRSGFAVSAVIIAVLALSLGNPSSAVKFRHAGVVAVVQYCV
jgi:hypothetical protein